MALGAALSLLAVAGEQLWLHYPHTTRYGLPQGATFRALSEDFSGVWNFLGESTVPLAPQTGLLVPLAAVAWAVAVLGDWAAFRLAARGEALLPAGIVFVLVAVFGADEGRILYPAITVACTVAFSLAHRSEQAPARREPPSVTRRRPRWPHGLATGTLTVAGGLLVTGALLPTLSGGPLDSWLEPGDEPSAPVVQVVLSPLAGVPGQLLENPELELFTVQSPQRAYWRLTALGSFDGFVWSLEGKHSAATDRLESSSTTAAPVTVVPQTYSIRALAAVWLPAAYQPTEFVTEGTPFEARFEPVSSTLLVSSSVASSNGFDYTVKSAVPRFDPAFLRSLSNDQAVVDETFLAVPQNLDGALGELAADVIEGRDGPYEQALALQKLVPGQLRVRPRRRSRPFQQSSGHLPAGGTAGILRAVRRRLRRAGTNPGTADAGGGGLHPRGGAGGGPAHRDAVQRARGARPRLAGGLHRRSRLGRLRAHPGPRPPRGGGVHPRRRAAGLPRSLARARPRSAASAAARCRIPRSRTPARYGRHRRSDLGGHDAARSGVRRSVAGGATGRRRALRGRHRRAGEPAAATAVALGTPLCRAVHDCGLGGRHGPAVDQADRTATRRDTSRGGAAGGGESRTGTRTVAQAGPLRLRGRLCRRPDAGFDRQAGRGSGRRDLLSATQRGAQSRNGCGTFAIRTPGNCCCVGDQPVPATADTGRPGRTAAERPESVAALLAVEAVAHALAGGARAVPPSAPQRIPRELLQTGLADEAGVPLEEHGRRKHYHEAQKR